MNKNLLLIAMLLIHAITYGNGKLSGTPIGTVRGIQYDFEGAYIAENIQENAFDGDLNSYFASEQDSYSWVGLDLGERHVIKKIGWAPANDENGEGNTLLGIFQGANRPDWLDAIPLYIIKNPGSCGKLNFADIDINEGFRYVRYVGPANSHCRIAELEFFGTLFEGECEEPHLYQLTNLPTVCINTVNAEEPYDKVHDIDSNIIIVNDKMPYVSGLGTVRERGNGSRTFPKKPWRIKFEKKQRVLPNAAAKAKKWTLINNYGDKTLMRNLIAFEIAKRIGMDYVPFATPVDVILNGEYKGCYQLCDQVEVNKGRLEITEMTDEDISGSALTGGYLFEIDAYAYQEPDGEWFRTSGKAIPVTIKSPSDGGSPEQFQYIKEHFEQLEKLVFNLNGRIPDKNDYRNIFDITSFLQHFIVGELSGNTDTYWSTFMYKERDNDKIFTGPVWDFDLAFENDQRTYPINDIAETFLYESGKASFANSMEGFVSNIIRNDPRTSGDLSSLWSKVRNQNLISQDSIFKYIDRMAMELEESQSLNFLRWDIMNEYVHQNPVVSGGYLEEVGRVKEYISKRLPLLDKFMRYDKNINYINNIETEDKFPVIKDNTISVSQNSPFVVYAVDGKIVHNSSKPTGALPKGIYVVKLPDGSSFKCRL